MEAAVTPELRTKFDAIRSRLDLDELEIPKEPTIDLAAAEAVTKATRMYTGVSVIAEPFAVSSLADDLKTVFADPAQLPRDPAEKKAAAKTAIGWLKRIAVGEVAGYDVRPAEPALRTALTTDDLAADAAEALARIAAPSAQLELVRVAGNAARPVPVRLAAADGAIRHIQSFGKLNDAKVDPATGDADATLRARLIVLNNLLTPAGEFMDRIKGYSPKSPAAPAPKPKDAEAKEKTDEKKDDNSKN